MFTGIVQACGKVESLQRNSFGARLVVDTGGWRPRGLELNHGDSICVSGVCLTLTDFTGRTLAFDVIAETLRRSTLGDLRPGDAVNLEPSLTPSTPIGGHFVQGHVDGVGVVRRVEDTLEEWRLTVAPPAELIDYMTPKGSIAISGVSLTIADVAADRGEVAVALIPTTLELTTLAALKQGDRVNLEADMLAKTIVHFLRRQNAGGMTIDKLRAAGFVE